MRELKRLALASGRWTLHAVVPARRQLAAWVLLSHRILSGMGIGGWWHIGKRQGGALPKQTRRALAGGVKALKMDGMLAGAQPHRTAIVAHCIAGQSADLGKGRAGFSHFHAVDENARAVAGEQMECVSAVGGNVDEAVPGDGVARKSLGVGAERSEE